MLRIIINAVIGKKRGGGGFQIACNFINTANNDQNGDVEWYYFVSKDIDDAIGDSFEYIRDKRYFVFPTQPDKSTHRKVQNKMSLLVEEISPNVLYSILAPSYMKFKCVEVMRCTNPWVNIKHLPKYVLEEVSIKTRLHLAIMSSVSRYQMRKVKYFVTQSQAAANGINQITHTGLDNIKVVPNVLPAAYNGFEMKKVHEDSFNIVYVTAPHPHKNVDIIPQVAYLLKTKYGLENIKFIITIPEKNKEFLERFNSLLNDYNVANLVENVGYQTQNQLKELYGRCDLFFFPSLLETFSVSLVEAMFFKMPIVATDIDFNREVTEDAALYFQPKNAEQAAAQIAKLIKDPDLYDRMAEIGQERIVLYNDYIKHFNETVAFLKDVAFKSISPA